jgi:hypothetical protein
MATNYTIDLNDDAFAGIHMSARREYLARKAAKGARVSGDKITVGGCDSWTREQAVRSVRTELDFAASCKAVMAEDNFISRAMRVRAAA